MSWHQANMVAVVAMTSGASSRIEATANVNVGESRNALLFFLYFFSDGADQRNWN